MLFLLLTVTVTVQANDYTVNSLEDTDTGSDTSGTLRWCINRANAAGNGPHTFTFETGVAGGTIILVEDLPIIKVSRVTIDGNGNGSENITIIAGPATDNDRKVFHTNGTAHFTTIKNFIIKNTGTGPFYFNGSPTDVTIENILVAHNGGNLVDYGIYYNGNARNFSVRNFEMFNRANVDSASINIKGLATNVLLDGITMIDPVKNAVRFEGDATDITIANSIFSNLNKDIELDMIYFKGTVNGLTITNVDIDMEVVASANDGKNGIYIAKDLNTDITKTAQISNVTIKEADVYGINTQGIVNNLTIDGCTISSNEAHTAISGGYGISITNNNNKKNITISNNVIENMRHSGIYFDPDGTDSASNIKIINNTVNGSQFQGIWLPGNNGVSDVDIMGNTIYDSKKNVGIYIQKVDGIHISQNNTYDNARGGIGNNGSGNDNLVSLGSSPVITESVSLGVGTQKVTFNLPAFCNNCDVEFFTNQVGDITKNGRTYIQTIPGLSGVGPHTANVNTGALQTGYWTTTLKDYGQNGSVSEYGADFQFNSKIGPGGVSFGIRTWLDADKGLTAIPDGVRWEDISGNGLFVEQTDNNLEATYIPTPSANTNFHPYIEFDGSDAFDTNAQILQSATSNGSVFFVATYTDFSGYDSHIDFDGGYPHLGRYTNAGQPMFWNYASSPNPVRATSLELILDKNQISGYLWNGGTNAGIEMTVDGTSFVNNTFDMTSIHYESNFRIGKRKQVNEGLNGSMSEVIVYDTNLNEIDKHKVESYLALKYGITLTHNYIASDGSVIWALGSTYDNDIAGIARDDIGMLNQKQSKSVNSDALVTIGLGSIETTNAANSNTFSSDNAFLVWGNDGGSTEAQSTEVPTAATAKFRLGREWKISETGNVDNLTLSFDNVSSKAKNVELFVATDGNFANATVLTGGTVIDGKAVFTGVDLNDGDVFTLGYTISSPGGVLSGLNLWLRADMGASADVSGTLTEWEDFANSNNAAQLGTNALPSLIDGSALLFNFNNAVEFTADNQSIGNITSIALGNTEFDIFTFTREGMKGEQFFNIGRNNTTLSENNWDSPGLRTNGSIVNRRASDGRFPDGANRWDKFSTIIPSITYHTFTESSVTKGYNGADTGSVYTYSPTKTAPMGGYILGSNIGVSTGGNELGLIGIVGEFITYNRNLSETERRRVDSYMAIKYGLTLDLSATINNYLASDASLIWNTTNNTAHNNDIAGIGRDDSSALNQKQSKSINEDAMLTIGLGGIATTNADNTNTFVTDKNFLLWGNNDGSTDLQTEELPIGANAKLRLGREWKVSETGNVTNLTIAFDNIGESAFDIELFVDTDGNGDLTDATVITGGTVTDGKVTFTGVDLNNGNVFTLGYTMPSPGGVATNLSLWLKANAGTTVDTGVSLWEDQSLSAHNASQTTASYQSILTPSSLNFNPGLTFDGNDRLGLPIGILDKGNTDYSIISVQTKQKNDYMTVLSLGDYNSYRGVRHSLIEYSVWDNGEFLSNWITRDLKGGTTVLNQPDIFTATYSNTVGRLIRQNAFEVGADLSTSLNYLQIVGENHVGSTRSSYNYFTGDINEIIVYNSKTTTGVELQQIESYLALKYGITLDQTVATDYLNSNGSVIWDATANAIYSNDIAGIAKDNVSALDQKQSKSANTDALVTIGLGGVEATNIANINTFLADESYLVWGNDNGSTDVQMTEMPSLANAKLRFGREWKISESGNVADLTIVLNNVPLMAYDLELFVDTDGDGDFSNATVISADTVLDGKAAFTGVDLNDNDLFTFGYTATAPGGVAAKLTLWLKADKDVYSDSGITPVTEGTDNVEQWHDQSLNPAFDGNQPSETSIGDKASYAINAINFNPSLLFEGDNDRLRTPNSISSTDFRDVEGRMLSAYIIGNSTNTSYGKYLHHANSGALFQVNSSHASFGHSNSASYSKDVGEQFRLLSGVRAGGGGLDMYLDGVANGSLNSTSSTTGDDMPLTIGTSNTDSDDLEGNISEIILYADEHSVIEQRRVQSYLALKYGITLDQTMATDYLASNASVIWDATANATYNNDIAGIARDDLSVLDQKQSKSIHSDALVTIGLGSIEATNIENSNTFATDKNFLLWGNDDGSKEVQTTELPTSAAAKYRLGREWKVQETGSVDNLTLTFDNVSESAYDIELYVDTDGDGDFSNATVIAGGTVIDGKATFTGVDLNNGDVFGLGLTAQFPGGVINNLSLWLKADAGTTIDTGVSLWKDQSLGAHDATQPDGDRQSIITPNSLNFNPGLTFDGSNDNFYLPTGILDEGNTNYSFFSVQTKKEHKLGTVLDIGTTGYPYRLYFRLATNPSSGFGKFYTSWDGNSISDGATITNEPDIFTAIYNNTTGRLMRQDGLQVVAEASKNLNFKQDEGRNQVGSMDLIRYFFPGDINEIIFYNTKSTTGSELQQIESYLALKYGITLDQTTATDYLASDGTTKMWDANINTAFKENIAGIGRDDISGLIQKQSRSVNPDALVTIGLGGIEASNLANTNSFSADKDFLVWGTNGAGTGIINTGIPDIFSEKTSRTWLVQETGSVGNTLVQIPNSAVAGFSDMAQVFLFVADDDEFTTGLVMIPLTQNGANWEFLYDFNGAKYFTVGIEATSDFMRHGKAFKSGKEQSMKF